MPPAAFPALRVRFIAFDPDVYTAGAVALYRFGDVIRLELLTTRDEL